MACPNCKCNKNKKHIDQEEYDELKEYLTDEIKGVNVVHYLNENSQPARMVEVEMEDHIIELENIDTNALTLDKVIDHIIRNNMK